MLAVAAGFFLVLSGTMMLGLFRWFRKIIDNTLRENTACATDLRTRLDDLADGVGAISEGLRPETRLRIRETVAIHFRYAVERVCRLIKRVREENNIRDHEATARKIRTLLKNIHDERNRAFDSYTYKGRKLSEYTDEGGSNGWHRWSRGRSTTRREPTTAVPTRTCGWPTTRSKTTSCSGWTNEGVGILALGHAPCGSVPCGPVDEAVRRAGDPAPRHGDPARYARRAGADTGAGRGPPAGHLLAGALRHGADGGYAARAGCGADRAAGLCDGRLPCRGGGLPPRLVNMELYRQTQVVTEIPAARPQRWGVGIQAGYGLAPRTGHFEPYIGVGIQYSIWQW